MKKPSSFKVFQVVKNKSKLSHMCKHSLDINTFILAKCASFMKWLDTARAMMVFSTIANQNSVAQASSCAAGCKTHLQSLYQEPAHTSTGPLTTPFHQTG